MRYYIGIGVPYQIKPHDHNELDDVVVFLKDLEDCEIVEVVNGDTYAEIVFDCFYNETLLKIGQAFELYVDPSEEVSYDVL